MLSGEEKCGKIVDHLTRCRVVTYGCLHFMLPIRYSYSAGSNAHIWGSQVLEFQKLQFVHLMITGGVQKERKILGAYPAGDGISHLHYTGQRLRDSGFLVTGIRRCYSAARPGLSGNRSCKWTVGICPTPPAVWSGVAAHTQRRESGSGTDFTQVTHTVVL